MATTLCNIIKDWLIFLFFVGSCMEKSITYQKKLLANIYIYIFDRKLANIIITIIKDWLI